MDRPTRTVTVILWMLAMAALAVGCGDTLPPSVPENLVVNATSSSTIDVSWDESSSQGGVDGYEVFRDGVFIMELEETEFQDSGLMNSTEYCYQVRAFNEDNESDKTEPECDTTFDINDTQNPTAPTNLEARAVNASEIILFWTSSTDDIGINKYNIFRNAAMIGSSFTNSYSDTGLTNATTYCYIVNAIDEVGKTSTASNQSCATTDF